MAPPLRFLLAFFALILFSGLPGTCARAAEPGELSSYKLGTGDVISVRVLGEDDLRRERVKLSDAGTLSFPVLGEIQVKGMTVGDLEDYFTKGL
jgi:polysaccharide export outer membrane protein